MLCLSDTKRFSHYWISGGFVTDPFLSDIHCSDTIFTHMPFPHLGSGFHFALCVKFPLFLFLWNKLLSWTSDFGSFARNNASLTSACCHCPPPSFMVLLGWHAMEMRFLTNKCWFPGRNILETLKPQCITVPGAGITILLAGCAHGRQARLLCCPYLVLTLCSLMNPDKTAPQFSQNLTCEV